MQTQRVEYIKADEAAEYLGIKKQTLYKKCQARVIPFCALGAKNYLFKISDLNDYIESHRVPVGHGGREMDIADAIFSRLEKR